VSAIARRGSASGVVGCGGSEAQARRARLVGGGAARRRVLAARRGLGVGERAAGV